MGREEIGPVNKGGMDLLNFSLIWWEWRETLRLRSVWTRETGDVMWKEGLAGGEILLRLSLICTSRLL